MNCQEIRDKDWIEAYVGGGLPEHLTEELEKHYFGCDRCAAYLHECRIAHSALLERSAAIYAESLPTQRAWPAWLPSLALAAAALLAAFLFWPLLHPQAPPGRKVKTPDYTELAKLDPPNYERLQLRGSDPTSAKFDAAMQYYSRGEYREAIAALRPVADTNREDPEPRFFLATAELLSQQPREAIADFQEVIKLGDRRFVDQSRFLAAKAWLQQNQPDEATQALQVLASGSGRYASSATILLNEIKALSSAHK